MTTHFSRLFQKRRLTLGLKPGQVIRSLGYSNLTKWCNRLVQFESSGFGDPQLIQKLVPLLGITAKEIQQAIWADFVEWNRQINQPIEPHLSIRVIPAVSIRKSIPLALTTPELWEAFASRIAEQQKRLVCLHVSQRTSVWFDETGKRYAITETVFPHPLRCRNSNSQQINIEFGEGGSS